MRWVIGCGVYWVLFVLSWFSFCCVVLVYHDGFEVQVTLIGLFYLLTKPS